MCAHIVKAEHATYLSQKPIWPLGCVLVWFAVIFLERHKIQRSKSCVEEKIGPEWFWESGITVLAALCPSYVNFCKIRTVERMEAERFWVSDIAVLAAPCPTYVNLYHIFCEVLSLLFQSYVTSCRIFCDASFLLFHFFIFLCFLFLLFILLYFLNDSVLARNIDKWMLSRVWVRFTVKSYASTIFCLIDNFHQKTKILWSVSPATHSLCNIEFHISRGSRGIKSSRWAFRSFWLFTLWFRHCICTNI